MMCPRARCPYPSTAGGGWLRVSAGGRGDGWGTGGAWWRKIAPGRLRFAQASSLPLRGRDDACEAGACLLHRKRHSPLPTCGGGGERSEPEGDWPQAQRVVGRKEDPLPPRLRYRSGGIADALHRRTWCCLLEVAGRSVPVRSRRELVGGVDKSMRILAPNRTPQRLL
jgi:hypothetical protein